MTIFGKSTTEAMGFFHQLIISGLQVYILTNYHVDLEYLVKVTIFLYFTTFPIIINKYWEACEIDLVHKYP